MTDYEKDLISGASERNYADRIRPAGRLVDWVEFKKTISGKTYDAINSGASMLTREFTGGFETARDDLRSQLSEYINLLVTQTFPPQQADLEKLKKDTETCRKGLIRCMEEIVTSPTKELLPQYIAGKHTLLSTKKSQITEFVRDIDRMVAQEASKALGVSLT